MWPGCRMPPACRPSLFSGRVVTASIRPAIARSAAATRKSYAARPARGSTRPGGRRRGPASSPPGRGSRGPMGRHPPAGRSAGFAPGRRRGPAPAPARPMADDERPGQRTQGLLAPCPRDDLRPHPGHVPHRQGHQRPVVRHALPLNASRSASASFPAGYLDPRLRPPAPGDPGRARRIPGRGAAPAAGRCGPWPSPRDRSRRASTESSPLELSRADGCRVEPGWRRGGFVIPDGPAEGDVIGLVRVGLGEVAAGVDPRDSSRAAAAAIISRATVSMFCRVQPAGSSKTWPRT